MTPPFQSAGVFAGDRAQVDAGPANATYLLTISNRCRSRAAGGLQAVLEPALRELGGIWLGRNGHAVASTPALAVISGEPTCATFDLTSPASERLYREFCHRTLWPLFHGFRAQTATSDDAWLAYGAANETYARFGAMLGEPSGTVWVHDYHLMLLGHALRARGHHGPLGLFLHVPFPSRDMFETLPWSDEILERLRAYDLIGVQTPRWAANLRACLDALPSTRRVPEVVVMPVGVEPHPPSWFEAEDPEVARLRSRLGERRLILAVDRLDYTKGIVEHLLAYEHLLERYPEWRNRVTFLQVSTPGDADDLQRAELRQVVDRLIGRINGVYGEADWVPIRYVCRAFESRVLAQLYRLADVALVTPLCDGLNLVAKEFIAAQAAEQPGALVLSRFAGAAHELADAILTNPYHAPGVASDLDRALCMSLDDRRHRHARLATVVTATTAPVWARRFLGRLRIAHAIMRATE